MLSKQLYSLFHLILRVMPIYHHLGNLPHKRHTQFEKPGGGLYHEQVFGTVGFEGTSSLLYHVHRPTQVKEVGAPQDVSPILAVENNLTMRKLLGFSVEPVDDFRSGSTFTRMPTPTNSSLSTEVAAGCARCSALSPSSTATTWSFRAA